MRGVSVTLSGSGKTRPAFAPAGGATRPAVAYDCSSGPVRTYPAHPCHPGFLVHPLPVEALA
jgi:hypothetical protein